MDAVPFVNSDLVGSVKENGNVQTAIDSEEIICEVPSWSYAYLLKEYDSESMPDNSTNHYKHNLNDSSVKVFSCKICASKFESANHLKAHSAVHNVSASAKQGKPMSESSTFESSLLRERLISKVPKKPGKYFKKRGAQTVVSHKNLTCSICDMTFENLNFLKSHTALHILKGRMRQNTNCGRLRSSEVNQNQRDYKVCTENQLRSLLENKTVIKGEMCDNLEKPKKVLENLRVNTRQSQFKNKIREAFKSKITLFPQCVSGTDNVVATNDKERKFACKICNKLFTSRFSLREHVRVHTGEKPHKCQICGKAFAAQGNCIRHQKSHVPVLPEHFKCSNCGKSFPTQKSFSLHDECHITERKSDEIIPNTVKESADNHSIFSSETQNSPANNLISCTPGLEMKCHICSENCSLFSDLLKHRKKHLVDKYKRLRKLKPKKKSYACNLCSKAFTAKHDLIAHKTTHPIFKCLVCEKNFSNVVVLKFHSQLHNSAMSDIKHERQASNFTCDICNFTSTCNNLFRQHLNEHSVDKPNLCGICGKSFYYPSVFKEHLLTHSNNSTYDCTLCGNKFSSKAALDFHSKIHEPGHRCDVCQKAFYSITKLRIHKSVHLVEKLDHGPELYEDDFKAIIDGKTHVCGLCGKSFATGYNLRQHITVHTGEKPHKCNVCGRGFGARPNLTRHMKIHSGVKPFVCTICKAKFYSSTCLKRHTKVHLKTAMTEFCKLWEEVTETDARR